MTCYAGEAYAAGDVPSSVLVPDGAPRYRGLTGEEGVLDFDFASPFNFPAQPCLFQSESVNTE